MQFQMPEQTLIPVDAKRLQSINKIVERYRAALQLKTELQKEEASYGYMPSSRDARAKLTSEIDDLKKWPRSLLLDAQIWNQLDTLQLTISQAPADYNFCKAYGKVLVHAKELLGDVRSQRPSDQTSQSHTKLRSLLPHLKTSRDIFPHEADKTEAIRIYEKALDTLGEPRERKKQDRGRRRSTTSRGQGGQVNARQPEGFYRELQPRPTAHSTNDPPANLHHRLLPQSLTPNANLEPAIAQVPQYATQLRISNPGSADIQGYRRYMYAKMTEQSNGALDSNQIQWGPTPDQYRSRWYSTIV